MQIKKIEKEGYNLHLLKTQNFKTISVKVIFWEKIIKEELTSRNLLINNLLFSSKKYPTNKEVTITKENLYGVGIGGGIHRKGNNVFSEFSLSVIEEKYTEKGLFEKSLEFFFEMILNPNIIDNKFEKDSYEINYESLKTDLKMANENPSFYSFLEYKKLLDKDKEFALSVDGTLEDLKKITPESLYEYYNKFITTNNIDILVAGNIDFEEIEKIITKLFIPKSRTRKIDNMPLTYEKEFTENIIKTNFSQSKLIMGSTLNKLTEEEKKYSLLVYNIILGNSPNSKLFKNIREKHSYAYNISSNFNRLDGIYYISAGISKNNYQHVKEEILKEIEKLKEGKFTQKEIKNAKETLFGVLKEIKDHQGAICDHYFSKQYFQSEDLEIQKEKIKNLTKEDILKVAKKINIDTILLVEEKENEKD